MTTVLIYAAIVYLALCYGFGLYLAIRLHGGRRLRHLLAGFGVRKLSRPLDARPASPSTTDTPVEHAAPNHGKRQAA